MNDFIEKVLRDRFAFPEKEKIKRAILKESKDPLFLADIKEVEKAFVHSDFEKMGK